MPEAVLVKAPIEHLTRCAQDQVEAAAEVPAAPTSTRIVEGAAVEALAVHTRARIQAEALARASELTPIIIMVEATVRAIVEVAVAVTQAPTDQVPTEATATETTTEATTTVATATIIAHAVTTVAVAQILGAQSEALGSTTAMGPSTILA